MLTLSHVTKTYSQHFRPVLSDVSLTFGQGQFCVILGSNGSGKSTLLQVIRGDCDIDSGHVWIHGKAIKDRTRFIASVTQDVNQGTIPQMSLLENVVLACIKKQRASLKPYRCHQQQALSYIRSLNMHLERYLHTPLQHLSGGQRQTVATLMALITKPEILLLDEHTSALDPKTQHALMTYTTQALSGKQMLTVMVTHHLEDALRYGNRLIMLHQGTVVLDVSGEDKSVLTREQLLQYFHRYSDLGTDDES